MTDPIRWSEADNATSPIEQSLVRAGQQVSMPKDERLAIWQSILSGVSAGATTPFSTPNAEGMPSLPKAAGVFGPTSILALQSAKVLLILAVLAGLGVGGYHWLGSAHAGRDAVFSQATALADPSAIPKSVGSTQVTPALTQPETATAATAKAQAPVASRASQLKEESLAVMAARQALRSNDAAKALNLLEQAQLKFKRGGLAEEREALTIEALAKLGQSARASAHARAFLAQYPRSPHAQDVQRFAK